MDLISIIMCTHNMGEYISESISSIVNQTYENWELIVINDFSMDNTLDILSQYSDPRIKVINTPCKMTLPILRNYGLELAKGKYVGYMDSDDIATSDRLRLQHDFLSQNSDIDVVGGDYKFFGDTDRFYSMPRGNKTIQSLLVFRSTIANGTVLMRKSLFDKHNLRYRDYLIQCEDYGLWVDMINKAKVENLPALMLYCRSGHSRQTIKHTNSEYLNRMRKVELSEIRLNAFNSFGFSFSNEDLRFINSYLGDANRREYTYEKLREMERALDLMLIQGSKIPIFDISAAEEEVNHRLLKFRKKCDIASEARNRE